MTDKVNVNPQRKACIIAEVGVNHDGREDRALRLVDAARQAGADAVKFQTFRAHRLASPRAPKAAYQQGDSTSTESQREMLESLELSEEAFRRIREHCRQQSIEFLSTPFDIDSAAFLGRIGVERFKVGSGDLTHLPLLEFLGNQGLPVILSTGMASNDEILEAVDCLRSAGAADITLLHCISRYPAPADELQLLRIPFLRAEFRLPVGYSDHSIGFEAALGALALGAVIIEKHLTLDRSLPGPDHAASADPEGFAELVQRLRKLESMLGSSERRYSAEEVSMRVAARKSIVALCDIQRGEALSEENIGLLRPGDGIAPKHWQQVLGRQVSCDLTEGEPLQWNVLQ